MNAQFDPAFYWMLPHEGRFQRRVADPGNWTGGKIGVGDLKGTKFGIAAASYPDLDIENLTINEAHDIYLRDYWNTQKYAELIFQVPANKIFDLVVNMGFSGGHKVVQRALIDCGHPVGVDGVFGILTLDACNSIQPDELIETICLRAEERYRDIVRANPNAAENLEGWLTRARAVPV